MDPPTLAASLLFAVTAIAGARGLLAMARIERPSPSSSAARGDGASVAVVVAARDEENTIEPALRALARGLDEGMELIVVDDRSTDRTGEIIAEVAAQDPRVVPMRVDALPQGWLGKNHALHVGSLRAMESERRPDLLLFTDADVHFEPGGLRAAADLAVSRGLDHLTGAPRVLAPGAPLQAMVATFGVLFALFTRPWRASDPRSRAHVGIGALNIVRTDRYIAAGGHGSIRLRIDDDIRLGELMKRSGGRSAFVRADRLCSVEWYPGLGAMVRGLTKNAFAAIEFRLPLAVLATAALLAGCVAPPVLAALPVLDPVPRALLAATALLQMVGAAESAASAGLRRGVGVAFSAGVVVFLWTLWRSVAIALLKGGVTWRDTTYDLAELRAATRR